VAERLFAACKMSKSTFKQTGGVPEWLEAALTAWRELTAELSKSISWLNNPELPS
jgi:hypothetical protein